MPNDLPLPGDLQHLIEKRDGDDRRQAQQNAPVDRRSGADRRGFQEDCLAGETITGPAKFSCGLCGKSLALPAGTHRLPQCDCGDGNATGWYRRQS